MKVTDRNEKEKIGPIMEYIQDAALRLLAIDSPSGYSQEVADFFLGEYQKLGVPAIRTKKGGVLADLGGVGSGVLLTAHADTLGAVVAQVKENGRLRISPVGGLLPQNVEAENCRIRTFDGRVYTGVIQLENASVHVNGDYASTARSFETLEVLLDEIADTKEEVQKLGIMTGNYVCVDPRTVLTPSGYIKSRFLDDKLSAAVLLGYAKYVRELEVPLSRKIYQHITVFEEVGHGGAASVPADVEEILTVDMGCVGDGLECTERQVSICVKDSAGPYHYETVRDLVQTAQENGIPYAADVYPHYGSDADSAMSAGHDLRHGLIGPGVYASHGYERSHMEGVKNTFLLLQKYLERPRERRRGTNGN